MENTEKKVTLAYYLAYIAEGLVASIFGPTMVYFAARTDSSMAQMSSTLLFYNLGFILASLTLVRLYEKHPGNRLVAAGIAVMILVLAGFCGVRNRALLFLLAFILGLAVGVIENGPNIMFPWLLKERCARPMNLIYLFYSVGAIMTPNLVGTALERGNTLVPVFFILAAAIFVPMVFLLSLPSPRPQEKAQEEDNTQEKGGLVRVLILFGIFHFFSAGVLALFSNWISTVMIYNGMADESVGARMSSLIWTGAFLGRLLAAWLAGRIPSAKIVLGGLLLSLAGIVSLFFCRGSLIAAGLCVLLFGVATGPMLANSMTMMKEQGLLSAKSNGIVLAFDQTGGLFMLLLFGRLFGDSHSSFIPFTVTALIAVAAEIVIFLFIPRKKA